MAKRTTRIYYGPVGKERSMWWDVVVVNAKKPVVVNGCAAHALKGIAGSTIGCAISNVGSDATNKNAFPHPCHLVSVTKSTAIVVDKLSKSGQPTHAVRYHHNYGHITEKNDQRTLKKMVKEQPDIMDRSFELLPPKKRSAASLRKGPNGNVTSHGAPKKSNDGRSFVPRGALRRAELAGLISTAAAKQIASSKPRAVAA
jgi:hypothetical protein